jgi:hypothetical protein
MAGGETHHLWYKKIFIPIVIPISLLVTAGLFWFKININPSLFLGFCFIQYWLAGFIGPDLDLPGLNDDDGRMMRFGKKLNSLLTIFGYLTVAYWFFYAWIIGLIGGHRSKFSHGIIIGTIGRIIYFNIPIFLGLFFFARYGIAHWNWINPFYELYGDMWILPYLLSQFVVWNITDETHLILDSEWAKGKLFKTIGEK